MAVKAGFLGCGEVAARFAPAMRESGAEVFAFDIVPGKAAAAGFPAPQLEELPARVEVIISTVTAQSAVEAARSCAPFLRPGHTYVDLNSVSPRVKLRVAEIVAGAGCEFAEGAILGAVGVTGAATRILIGGAAGERVAALLRGLGLKAEFHSEVIGRASAFKMLRGVFSKGMEALILELLVAGLRAGIADELWEDVRGFMLENPFDAVASNWVRTHPAACERRYHELSQIVETVRESGLNPLMTMAAEAFFERSRGAGLPGAFPAKPETMREVAAWLEKRLGVIAPAAACAAKDR